MKVEGDLLAPRSVRHCDVCVIGAGAAGITIARELSKSNLKIVLLEAGGFKWSQGSQDAYEAESASVDPVSAFDSTYPSWSRLRYFGGSTNHWGGWCRPFDELDFEHRPWIPNSGWPIGRKELEPYYERAAEYLQMTPFDFEKEKQSPGPYGVATQHFQYSPPTRFGHAYRADLEKATNVELILNGNAVRFDCKNGRVEKLLAKNSLGEEFSIVAKKYVLACGGLENPRLLLNSDHQLRGGLGNQYDMVGRGFMEHPHTSVGLFVNIAGALWHKPFTGTAEREPLRILTTTADFQAIHQTMNYSCQLMVKNKAEIDTTPATAFTKFLYDKAVADSFLVLYVRSEMYPNFNNRVSLGTQQDAFGLRRLKLDVSFSNEDLQSIVKSTEAVIRDLSSQSLGRGAVSLENDAVWSADLGVGCHHMGTTRMSDNPRTGVVDRNCKVHGVDNLYVGGSSVFTTGSYANPTITLVALAVRLAEYLRIDVGGAA